MPEVGQIINIPGVRDSTIFQILITDTVSHGREMLDVSSGLKIIWYKNLFSENGFVVETRVGRRGQFSKNEPKIWSAADLLLLVRYWNHIPACKEGVANNRYVEKCASCQRELWP